LIPESGKVVLLDTDLPMRQAFHALHEQGVSRATACMQPQGCVVLYGAACSRCCLLSESSCCSLVPLLLVLCLMVLLLRPLLRVPLPSAAVP
jgi:hypothetical protein